MSLLDLCFIIISLHPDNCIGLPQNDRRERKRERERWRERNRETEADRQAEKMDRQRERERWRERNRETEADRQAEKMDRHCLIQCAGATLVIHLDGEMEKWDGQEGR